MALQLNFNLCQSNSCKDLTIKEVTGIYNDPDNLGGYGTPNIDTSDIETAVMDITSPSGVDYSINLYTEGFPTEDILETGYNFTLTPNIALEDGKWTFVITYTTSSETYTKTIYKLLTCNSECCVKQLLDNLDLEDCGCDCKSVTYDNYIKAWSFLQALKNAAKCGNTLIFDKLLKIVTKICKNKDCKTCK